MIKRRAAVVLLACGALVPSSLAGQVQAAPKKLTYSIKEARAYAFKVSLSKEVIEAVPKCNPEEDPYACTGWNHKPNCPKAIVIGPKGKAPVPKPPKNVKSIKGGAGDDGGLGRAPEQSTPVRVNRFLSLAKMSSLFNVKESGGLASEIYTDSSGRSEPEAHVESEGYSGNAADYEERCYWNDDSGNKQDAYEHYMSRSGTSPNTYQLAECVGRQCNFGLGVNAERARSIVSLTERGGKVMGSLRSSVEGLSFGGGAMTIDHVATFARFETDGTPGGLKWSVSSTAVGGKLGDQPISLPPGEEISGPGFSVGMSQPFVGAPKDGRELTVVAPGLFFGSDEQAVFFGGAEVYMSMSRQAPSIFDPTDPDPVETSLPGETGGTSPIGDPGAEPVDTPVGSEEIGKLPGSEGAKESEVLQPQAVAEDPAFLIFEQATGIGAVVTMVALGALAWLLLMSRWLQRYSWGRRMTRVQPFRLVDWLYRAFVKT